MNTKIDLFLKYASAHPTAWMLEEDDEEKEKYLFCQGQVCSKCVIRVDFEKTGLTRCASLVGFTTSEKEELRLQCPEYFI